MTLAHTYNLRGEREETAADVGGTADFLNTYTYDFIGQMTRLEQTGQSGGASVADKRADHEYQTDEEYEYDDNGNRTMTSYSTGTSNRLLSAGRILFRTADSPAQLGIRLRACYDRVVRDITSTNFGLVIAYLLPGFVVLIGASYFSETMQAWLGATPSDSPTVGGFLYVTVGSIAAGVAASTVRWVLIDTLHHWTGLREPRWDFSRLGPNTAAFEVLIEVHYRYYQFHANMVVAVAFAYAARKQALGLWSAPEPLDFAFLVLEGILLLGSRDTLLKYYTRVGQLLGAAEGTALKQAPR